MAVRIITDSAADLSPEYIAEHDITVVPLKTIFPDGEYIQGVNLGTEEFYEKLIESTQVPRTSQATPYEFLQIFNEVVGGGTMGDGEVAAIGAPEDVVVITISSGLSGTYESACSAAAEFMADPANEGKGRIFVVDSLNVTVGQNLLVDRAVALRGEDKSAEEIAAILNEERNDVHLMAALDTLEYLKRGGRISSAAAIAGGLLNIKPVIAAVDGKVALIGKARGSKQSNNLLRSKVFEAGGIDFDRPVRIGYTGLSDAMLRKYMRDSGDLYEGYHDGELPVTHIGSVIGTHAGPGAIVIAFFGKI